MSTANDEKRFLVDPQGNIKDEYGNQWSTPLKAVPPRWAQQPTMRVFGELMTRTTHLVDWRVQTHNGRFTRLTAYYPDLTPADRLRGELPPLYADVESGPVINHQVTWYGPHGRHTFNARRDCQDAAIHFMEQAIKHITTVGDAVLQPTKPKQQAMF